MHRLTIGIGIEKSPYFVFAHKGTCKMKCPCCGFEIVLELSGLDSDQSISPTVSLVEEWAYENED